MTDMEVAHGCDHVDHMGTESWRCAEVNRIEGLLGEVPKPEELA